MDVDSNKHVQVENNGIRTVGSVSVHQIQFGLVLFVSQMLAVMDKYGMIQQNHVNV